MNTHRRICPTGRPMIDNQAKAFAGQFAIHDKETTCQMGGIALKGRRQY